MFSHLSLHLDMISDILVAQSTTVTSTDLLDNIQKAFQNFLSSGQAGALAIGWVFGYVIRGMTR
jgi:BioD-like phosphotransacetylase family protein